MIKFEFIPLIFSKQIISRRFFVLQTFLHNSHLKIHNLRNRKHYSVIIFLLGGFNSMLTTLNLDHYCQYYHWRWWYRTVTNHFLCAVSVETVFIWYLWTEFGSMSVQSLSPFYLLDFFLLLFWCPMIAIYYVLLQYSLQAGNLQGCCC